MEIGKGRDHLAKYSAPMPHHLMFPTAKIKNATGIIGLFRPLRRHARMERNALLRCVRVAVAADPVGDPRDGGARAPGSPLEEEVLEEVRRAALERLFGGRAARHRDREREALHVAHRVQPHRRPVRAPPNLHARF